MALRRSLGVFAFAGGAAAAVSGAASGQGFTDVAHRARALMLQLTPVATLISTFGLGRVGLCSPAKKGPASRAGVTRADTLPDDLRRRVSQCDLQRNLLGKTTACTPPSLCIDIQSPAVTQCWMTPQANGSPRPRQHIGEC